MNSYAGVHANRGNLLIHLFAVPLFWWGSLGSLYYLAMQDWVLGLGHVLLLPIAMGFQGAGHKREKRAPDRFAGPANFLRRTLTEQFYRFPRFVLSGGWEDAWSAARQKN